MGKMTVIKPGILIFDASNPLEPLQIHGWTFSKEESPPSVRKLVLTVLNFIKDEAIKDLNANQYELEKCDDGTYGTNFCIENKEEFK